MDVRVNVFPLIRPLPELRQTEPCCEHLQEFELRVEQNSKLGLDMLRRYDLNEVEQNREHVRVRIEPLYVVH